MPPSFYTSMHHFEKKETIKHIKPAEKNESK